jgi:hypothetical protein
MVTKRHYLRPEFLVRIPIEGLSTEEIGDVIGKVGTALHQLTASVEIGLDVVDLVIRDVLEQHRRERSTAVGAGPVALLPVPESGEEQAACTCEGGDIGLPHITDCPLYETATAPADGKVRVPAWGRPEDEAEPSARVLVLRPEDPDPSVDG